MEEQDIHFKMMYGTEEQPAVREFLGHPADIESFVRSVENLIDNAGILEEN